MHDAYDDIRSRIDEPPAWFDVHGCPRWGVSTVPRHLMGWIACQACGALFFVSLADPVYVNGLDNRNIQKVGDYTHDHSHLELVDHWHYGDPPQHGCVGDTMNSIPQHEWGELEKCPDPDAGHETLVQRSAHSDLPER
jgi:hypothetical protein